MKILSKLAVVAAVAALGAPALSGAAVPENAGTAHKPADPGSQAQAHKPATTPTPTASPPAQAKAYGKHCQDQSKKRVAGEKGTAFSRCVTAMAKLAKGTTKSPRTACKDLSKKRVAGEKGTPFSRCVSAAAKLLKEKAAA